MQYHLETPRLILRAMCLDDAEGMFDLDSRSEVAKYLLTPPLTAIEQSREIIRYVLRQYEEHGIGRFAVEWKATGEFVGWAGLKFLTEPINGHVNCHDLGYRLLPKFWGMGIATEASRASLDLAFNQMGLQKVYAGALPENVASCTVLQKIGMRLVNQFELEGGMWNWYVVERDTYAFAD